MNAKKNRLGRGLDALLGEVSKPHAKEAAQLPGGDQALDTPQGAENTTYKDIPVDLLDTGEYQPRTHIDEQALQELASSIKSEGLIQPLLVRTKPNGRYEILAGHRRWRASQRAGLDTVPAVVKEVSDQAALAVALIENIQREDLNPIEEAMGIKRLMDEFSATHEQIAQQIGRSRTSVTNLLRLLSLNPVVRDHLENAELDMGHARALLPLSDNDQLALSKLIIARGLTVRDTEKKVRQMLSPATSNRLSHLGKDADVLQLESQLSAKLGAKVSIQQGRKKGKLVIEYYSLDELDGLLKRIG